MTVIEEANWLTLANDISHLIGEGFDAVICLGNSFAHMPDTFDDQREQRYETFVILYIDHIRLDYLYFNVGAATLKTKKTLKIIKINRFTGIL